MKTLWVVCALGSVALAQQTPSIVRAGGNLNVNAPFGDVTLSTQTASCTASSLCGINAQLTTMAGTIADLQRAMTAAQGQIAQQQTTIQNLQPNTSQATLTANSASTDVFLGTVNSAGSVVRIDVQATGCSSLAAFSLTVATSFGPDPSNVDSTTPMVTAATYIMSADGISTTTNAASVVDVMYMPTNNNAAVQLVARLRPIPACTNTNPGDQGATTATFAVSTSMGIFTPATSPSPPSGTWMSTSKVPVGQLAATTDARLAQALACSQTGMVWDPAARTCQSPSAGALGGMRQVVTTVSNPSASPVTRVITSMPFVSGYAVSGQTEHWCVNSGSGSGTSGSWTGYIVLAGTTAQTVRNTWTAVGTPPPSGPFYWTNVNGMYQLVFTAPAGMECVVSLRYYNGSATFSSVETVPIINPSFEDVNIPRHNTLQQVPQPGWSYVGSGTCGTFNPWTTGHYDANTYALHDGVNVLYTNGQCGVAQTTNYAVTAGDQYNFTFWAFKRSDIQYGGHTARICSGSCDTAANVFGTATNANGAWAPTSPFTNAKVVSIVATVPSNAPSGYVTIDIRGIGPQSNFDRISLVRIH